ncbi:hypothetical protein AVEN_203269-1 [Araneus ventricosus]|uniref:Tc1-like transposase DDE domain-containing protein n=1 Tax=Araneus ventricosus TaxID=182803 RepID=A0A4Y2WU83_ARAVE|nr:hypothetical protein AVEN_203269-1 [Araneus ventricosus]
MLQFASSDSSAESEIAKAESMSRRNHLHDEMRWRAFGMLQAVARQAAVARELNMHRSAIHRLWNHYQRDQNASTRRGSGRRRIITTADDRFLLQCARRRRTLTARQLASQLPGAAGRWGHALFTDESRFNIQNDSRRAMIWREPGTLYRAPNIVERDYYRSGGLLVWAGIATNGRTDLCGFAGGSVTAVRYRDEILHSLVRPFIAAMGIDSIFMDDNPRRIEHD